MAQKQNANSEGANAAMLPPINLIFLLKKKKVLRAFWQKEFHSKYNK